MENYLTLSEWIIGFFGWRIQKTLAEIRRYKLRRSRGNFWGKKIYYENLLGIRRILESWKIKPPKVLKPYQPALVDEHLATFLQGISSHILAQNQRMRSWYCEINNKALALHEQKATTGKKRVTPTSAHVLLEKDAEYATMYTPWINFRGTAYTVLEAVEIAEFGRTHKIPPEMTSEQYQVSFVALLSELGASEDEIQGFPKVIGWNQPTLNAILLTLATRKPHYARAFKTMFDIHSKQIQVANLKKWKEDNNLREAAGQHPLSFDDWLNLPTSSDGPKESWITGNILPPHTYQMVPVEATGHDDYKTVIGIRSKIRAGWSKKTKDAESQEEVVKCVVCHEKDLVSAMDHPYMHKTHRVAFQKYTSRVRGKGANQDDQGENNNNNTEILTPPPTPMMGVENTTNKRSRVDYKPKYDSVLQTISRWADLDDPEEIAARVKEFKRRRCSEPTVKTQKKTLE